MSDLHKMYCFKTKKHALKPFRYNLSLSVPGKIFGCSGSTLPLLPTFQLFLWIIFKAEKFAHLNNQRIKTIVFCKLYHFVAALWTKKRFPFPKSRFFKWGDCQNFKVIGPEEMPIFVWGQRKCPPNLNGIDLRLIKEAPRSRSGAKNTLSMLI